MGLIFKENFDAEPEPGLPIAGWGPWGPNFTSSTTQFRSSPNSLRHNTATSDQNFTTGSDNNRGNAQVSLSVRFDTLVSAEVNWQISLRDDGGGGNNYLLVIEPAGSASQGLSLYKVVAGVVTGLGAGSTVLGNFVALSSWYRMQLQANASTISGYLQRLSDGMWLTSGGTFGPTKVTAVSVTDTTFSGTGVYSIACSALGTDLAYADDFLAESLDMPVVKPFVGGQEPYYTQALIAAGELW